MFNLNVYELIMKDGSNCYIVNVPAKSVKDAKKYVEGNGEVVRVTDVTNDYPIDINKVGNALKNADFGQAEIDIITRTLHSLKNTL